MPRLDCRLVIACLLPLAPLQAQELPLAEPSRWSFEGSLGEIDSSGSEPILRVTGQATLEGTDFGDGEIAFEIRLADRPSFSGFLARVDATGDHAEDVYLRPHKSGEWDAMQYQPVQNGSSTWQLHAGEGYTAAVDLPAGEWIPVRARFAGREAEIYVGDATTGPTMRFRPESASLRGGLAFWAGARGGAVAGVPVAEFRRIRIDPTRPELTARPASPTPDASFIRQWRIGTPVAIDSGPIGTIPGGRRATAVDADLRGVVNLNAAVGRVPDADRSAVAAETIVHADRSGLVAMAFDYSDDVSIFLGGRLLFSGENGWQSRYPYYMGLVSPEALRNVVWLPLQSGDNRLVFVVAERAFGWGFAAQLADRPQGVTWRRP
jgi:hypothetical protein